MKQLYKNLTYTLLATSLLCACSSDNDPIEVDSTNDRAINFRSYVGQTTRGEATPTALETLYTNGFKVFANKTANDWATNGANSQADFMYDQIITRTGTDINGHWEYSPVKLWPAAGTVSFFAYSPYASELVETSATTWEATGATKLTYTVPATSQAQQDLIAAASFNYTKDSHQGAVDFNFYHTLSRLSFTANTADLADGTSIDISKLAVRYADGKIRHKAVLDLGGVGADMTNTIWSDTDTPSYFTAADNNLDAGSVLEGQRLLVGPQDHQEGDIEILVSYTLTTIDDNLAQNIVKEVTDKVIVVPAIQGGWQPNKQYTYNLTITPEVVSFARDIKVSAWDAATTHDAVPPQPKYDIYYSSEEDAFHIGSAEGLAIFRDIVNGENQEEVSGYPEGAPNNEFANGVLEADIDLSTVCGPEIGSWIPIGDYSLSRKYLGTFDGNSHTINSLYISTHKVVAGLFGHIEWGHLRNLSIGQVNITSQDSHVGAFFGYGQNCTFENCHLVGGDTDSKTSSISSQANYVGGFCGVTNAPATYTNCSVRVSSASLTISSSAGNVGGFAAHISNATVKNCAVIVNQGELTISGRSSVSAGIAYSNNNIICNTLVDCGNGTIQVTGQSGVGGLFGDVTESTIVGSYSAITSLKTTDSNGAYMVAQATNSNFYGCWSYCANALEAPATDGLFASHTNSNFHSSTYGTSPITNMDELNADIATYNTTADPDKQAVPYTDQGTYGPIW